MREIETLRRLPHADEPAPMVDVVDATLSAIRSRRRGGGVDPVFALGTVASCILAAVAVPLGLSGVVALHGSTRESSAALHDGDAMSDVPDGQNPVAPDVPPSALPDARRTPGRLLHGLLALVIFLAGAVAGGALAAGFLKHHMQHILTHPDEAAEQVAGRLRNRLHLTDDQFDQVWAILSRRHGELEGIRREVFPQVRSVLDGAHEEIAAVLNEGQRKLWAEHYDHIIRNWFPPPPADLVKE